MAVTAQRFVRRNRKGRVLTVAREHYLRGEDSVDPLGCPTPASAYGGLAAENARVHLLLFAGR